MYYLKKVFTICSGHKLDLPYDSECRNYHGHNWIITVYIKGENVNKNGMLIDFSLIKNCIKKKLDHKNISDILPFNSTAENLARYILEVVNHKKIIKENGKICYRVDVEETQGSIASYEI